MSSSLSSISSFSSSSSSDDEKQNNSKHIDNVVGKMVNYIVVNHIPEIAESSFNRRSRRHCERNREEGEIRLYNDYFGPNPVYSPQIFRRRFRMQRHVFIRLVQAAESYDPYFRRSQDATGRMSISSLQKCTSAIRLLAYGEAYDRGDEYLRLAEGTARQCLSKFTEAMIAQFGSEYLRSPTQMDLNRLLQIGEQRGFPGMLGSVDCMHWQWKNCPVGWKGQYQGRSAKATVILEAVASQDLWIWHSFFGIPGSCNDINVLHRSPLFDDMLNGRAPRVNFIINNNNYDTGYYLTDGIYPKWSTFVQSIPLPQTPKDKLFAERQEAARKDVERAFGVLQARFAIIKRPALCWDQQLMHNVLKTCIILHNMIVEDERDTYANYTDLNEFNDVGNGDQNFQVEGAEFSTGHIIDIGRYLVNRQRLRNKERNLTLRTDLIDHIWQLFGNA